MKPRLHIGSEWGGFTDYYPDEYFQRFQMDACWSKKRTTDLANLAVDSMLDVPEFYRVIIFGNNNNGRKDIEANFSKGAWKVNEDGELIFSVSDRIA